MATRRRRRPEDLPDRELGETGKETAGERTLAGEAVRLQELLGNVSATEVMARSALQRQATETEAAPAKSGEEPDKAHTYTMTLGDIGTFDVVSWSPSVGNEGSTGGGGGAEKADFSELSVTKRADALSPRIRLAATEGQHIATAELRAQKSGAVFVLKLEDVLITAYQANLDADPPLETITLNFAESEYEHGDKKTK